MPEISERHGFTTREKAQRMLDAYIRWRGGSGQVFEKDGRWSFRHVPPGG